ncbi:ESPR-type extended signal peptide-containing protein, partial [Acinetobacter sp. MD2]|uniref:ESPR-type extended signal peptide-containing protein n=1 Tax=Acinetobacter sp. MD2 TaxID=2600066 RepID=UPI002D1EFD5C
MNKTYRLIWSSVQNAWIAVSELAKGKTKSSAMTSSQPCNHQLKPINCRFFKMTKMVSFIILASGTFTTSLVHAGAGIFINDGTDNGCTWTYDQNGVNLLGNYNGTGAPGASNSVVMGGGASLPSNAGLGGNANTTCIATDRATQTTRVLFYGNGTSSNSLTLGGDAYVNSGNLGLGGGQTGTSKGSLRIGGGASSLNGLAGVGTLGQTSGTYAIAIGGGETNANATVASADQSIAVGYNAKASIVDSIALGPNATTVASVNSALPQTINGKSYTAIGTAATGVVSVGSATVKRQIQNVAAGQVIASSTDAVNGSQLFNTNTELAKVATDTAVALGGGAAAGTSAGGITAPSYNLTTDPSTGTKVTSNNVGGALTSLDTAVNKAITFTGNARKSGDTTDVVRKLGNNINISGLASTSGTFSGANIKTVTDQSGSISIQIADAPNFSGTVTSTGQQVNGNSIITGTSTIGSGANAVTLSGTANGLDVGGKKITNVANAVNANDAINKGQLDAATAASSSKTDA